MKKLSLVASAIILSSTFAMAESNSIKEAFANGTTSGDITLFYQSQDNDKSTDSGVLAGEIGLNYETDSFMGFSAAVGFRAQHDLWEDNDGDFDGAYANNAIMNVANIKYGNDDFFAIVGRQEIDLEWLGDFNEAVVVGVTAIADTTIVAGYTNRQAAVDPDEVTDFEELTKNGAYVLDVKTSVGIDGLELNPYFYTAPDAVDFYGLKASYDNDIFGVTGHYAASSVDSVVVFGDGTEQTGIEDGDIMHLEARLNVVENLGVAFGYISTDSKGGTGLMDTYGDNISPFEDGNNTYAADADTWYLGAEYAIGNLGLLALYGQTDYDNNLEEAELNLGVSYAFTEELSAELLYVNYNDKDNATDTGDYDKILAGISYSF